MARRTHPVLTERVVTFQDQMRNLSAPGRHRIRMGS